jgi:hypothetical protein
MAIHVIKTILFVIILHTYLFAEIPAYEREGYVTHCDEILNVPRKQVDPLNFSSYSHPPEKDGKFLKSESMLVFSNSDGSSKVIILTTCQNIRKRQTRFYDKSGDLKFIKNFNWVNGMWIQIKEK